MTLIYTVVGIVTVLLFAYLVTAMLKPELFP
jgi:K+-transporting ATPase KdpF subunit